MEMYIVRFDDEQQVLNEQQLLDFVRVAIIRNKDISTALIDRIVDVDVNEYGEATYVTANKLF